MTQEQAMEYLATIQIVHGTKVYDKFLNLLRYDPPNKDNLAQTLVYLYQIFNKDLSLIQKFQGFLPDGYHALVKPDYILLIEPQRQFMIELPGLKTTELAKDQPLNLPGELEVQDLATKCEDKLRLWLLTDSRIPWMAVDLLS